MSTYRRRSSWFARRITGRARYPIILLWLAAAAAAYLYLPGIRATQGGEISLLAPANSAAIHTEEASSRLFAVPATSRTVIVQHDPRGLSSAAQQRIVTRAAALTEHRYPDLAGVAGALPVVNVPSLLPFAGQSHTTGLTYLFFRPSVGLHERGASSRH
ncbi:MAG TPA: hypothetical protein VFN57_08490 [Thermomicrobiaceae bacterium]|nr:hypothetical protein [Thermomicrobiaceae bacterium]